MVDDSFVNGSPWTFPTQMLDIGPSSDITGYDEKSDIRSIQENILDTSKFDHLDLKDCLSTFSAPWVTVYDALVLVAAPQEENSTENSLLATALTDGFYSYTCSWICNKPYFVDKNHGTAPYLKNVVEKLSQYGWYVDICPACGSEGAGATQWTGDESTQIGSDAGLPQDGTRRYVKECYSRKAQQKCRVLFSLPMMIVVIVCNLLKLATFIWCLRLGVRRPLGTFSAYF